MDADLMVGVLINLADNAIAAGAAMFKSNALQTQFPYATMAAASPKALLGRVTQPFSVRTRRALAQGQRRAGTGAGGADWVSCTARRSVLRAWRRGYDGYHPLS